MPFSQEVLQNWPEDGIGYEDAVSIIQISLRRLRAAIQHHEVSFPAQVPVFACQSRADIQWRLVELYFVRNWSCADLGQRYGVTMERARQLISLWVRRAAMLGYLQEIPAAEETTPPTAERIVAALEVSPPVLSPELEPNSVVLAASH
jgi:hypothetical protein